mmetsp:Transcript_7731/g.11660  ORF Transcript_7731/g.11660 Transcript_7731/m.11660 type:complete len:106 (+) Transcript_7731:159-476(+)
MNHAVPLHFQLDEKKGVGIIPEALSLSTENQHLPQPSSLQVHLVLAFLCHASSPLLNCEARQWVAQLFLVLQPAEKLQELGDNDYAEIPVWLDMQSMDVPSTALP